MTKSSINLNRRDMLAGGATLGILRSSSVAAQVSNTTRSLPSDTKVTLTLDGRTYQYPGGPEIPSYYVAFRNDGRIVFHLGALGKLIGTSVPPKPYHLGPHQVRIEREGTVVFNAALPAHWWNAEWTFRPAPFAAGKKPAQIVAANRMFPFGDTGCRYGKVSAIAYSTMGSSSVLPYMPTTGERRDIGLITDWSAWYMLTGDPGPMLEIAQAAASWPLHYRDEMTGKPVDLLKYPQANCYESPAQGRPWFQRYPLNPDGSNILGGGMVPQQAHFCEMSYMAHIATGDLGFLEDLQYSANFMLLCDSAKSTSQKAIVSGETRGVAWALRELFMAHVATLDVEAVGPLPPSLHPSSYFKKLLDNALEYYSPIMANPDAQVFRVFAGLGKFGLQQMSYMLNVMAFGVLTGHTDWTPFYLWCLGNAVAITSGRDFPLGSGNKPYPPGFGTPVWVCTSKDNDPRNPRFTSWGELYEDIFTSTERETRNPYFTQAVYDKLKTDPLNGGKSFNDPTRTMTTRANLVLADYLDKRGLAAVRAKYPEFDTCLKNVNTMIRAYGSIDPRSSVIS